MNKKIGVLVGWEQSFPQAFIERCNKVPGVEAELAKFGGHPEKFQSPYSVIIDRLSHEVKFYRFALKAAALSGTFVINDPFWWSADDKFFGYSLASRMGIAIPRTVLLPQKDYVPSIDKKRSLRNLEFPINWEAIMNYIGFPAVLKPADGGGWRDVSIVKNPAELFAAYDRSGDNAMTLQEFIDFDLYIRCLCIGKDRILPIQYDPKLISHLGTRGAYIYNPEMNWMSKELHDRVVGDAIKINEALNYDMNSVEFAVKDGVPYAIDFTNPAPDMNVDSILEPHFNVVVDWMVEFAVKAAKGELPATTRDGYRWGKLAADPKVDCFTFPPAR
jgi:hypothetical protein